VSLIAVSTFYSELIDAYGKAGLLQKMDSTFMLMRVTGVPPNEHTYSALIDGYGKHGMVDKAERVLHDMLKAGIAMNLVAFTSIIDAYGTAQRFEVRLTDLRYPALVYLLTSNFPVLFLALFLSLLL
jgi:pentatricopeptide repeat protein